MCLSIPGRVVKWLNRDPLFAEAEVEFDGVRRNCQMACVLEAHEGDYVLVHAGLAISRVDAETAAATLADLARLSEGAEAREDWRRSSVADASPAGETGVPTEPE
jgi:hydrogenase expression/formation protein HypC